MSEMVEGSQAWERFKSGARAVLSVSREELMRREAAYQRESARNPKRRGPKPKSKKKRS